MNNTLISVLIGLVLVAGIGFFVYTQRQQNDYTPQPVETSGNNGSGVSGDTRPALGSGQDSDDSSGSGEGKDSDGDSDDDAADAADQVSGGVPSTASGQAGAGSIAMAQVAQHNSRTSCWSAINGNVYDLTSWIPNHPGGEQGILQLCGTDGSVKFNKQHGDQQRQATVLAGFKIGVLP